MKPQPLEITEFDREMTARALDLARKGVGLVSPNPLVGCVVVSLDGKIVGEGSYELDKVTHAEVLALEQAGDRALGGTAYVSLEPHDHHGKTRPCTEALIEAGISRVVCPIEDPNPLVSGKGFERLRSAGIKVVTGTMAEEASRINEKFIVWHRKRRPFVHLKMAMSLDGRISLGKEVSTAITGERGWEAVQSIRHEHDAILIGSNTAVVDDPLLTDRSGLLRRRSLVRIVLDDRLRLSPQSKLAATTDFSTIVFTGCTDAGVIDAVRASGVKVISIKGGARNLSRVLAELKDREIQSVLIEGGAEVAGAFVDAHLVDKVTFIYSPFIFGGPDAPAAIGGKGVAELGDALRLKYVEAVAIGDEILVNGYPSDWIL